MGEDGVSVLGELALIAVVVACGGHFGRVGLLGKHDSYIDGISFYFLDCTG